MIQLSAKAAAAIGVVVLLGSYALHRRDEVHVRSLLARETRLRRPLRELPTVLGDWVGTDLPMEKRVVEIAAADDYVKRRYRHVRTGEALDLYIPFYGSHRALVGHHPERCLEGTGWKKIRPSRVAAVHDETGDESWPMRIHWYQSGQAKITVMSSYLVCGDWTADREAAKQASHRWLSVESLNYLLQVQLTLAGDRQEDGVPKPVGSFFPSLARALYEHLPRKPSAAERMERE